MGLRAGALWWVASLLGAPLGLALGLLASLTLQPTGFCLLGPCSATVVFPFGILFTINLGVLGLAQALTLRGGRTKIGWALGSFVAGAAFGFTVQGATGLLKTNPQVIGYLPGAIAGLAYGVVETALIGYLRSREPAR